METSRLETTRPDPKRLALTAGLAGALAAFANTAVYVIARALGAMPEGVLVETPRGAQPITLAPVLTASFVPALVAALVLGGLVAFTRRGVRTFIIVALAVLVVSMLPVVTTPGLPFGMRVALGAMHVVAWGVITNVLVRRGV